MKTLDEHNKQAREWHIDLNSQRDMPNGIACPKCGGELVDVDRGRVLASNPPQYDVKCPACGYRGYRVC